LIVKTVTATVTSVPTTLGRVLAREYGAAVLVRRIGILTSVVLYKTLLIGTDGTLIGLLLVVIVVFSRLHLFSLFFLLLLLKCLLELFFIIGLLLIIEFIVSLNLRVKNIDVLMNPRGMKKIY
jgi:hypothetical protein